MEDHCYSTAGETESSSSLSEVLCFPFVSQLATNVIIVITLQVLRRTMSVGRSSIWSSHQKWKELPTQGARLEAHRIRTAPF